MEKTIIGIYEVIEECDHRTKCGHKLYNVRCVYCGKEAEMMMSDIHRAKQCRHKTITGELVETRKKWKDPKLAKVFHAMVNRCYRPGTKGYQFYGGKGIRVCDEWLKDTTKFEQWAEENGYFPGLSIDRIDSDKNYCPENCRWITPEQNSRYKSNTNIIKVNGTVHSGREWAAILNFGVNRINRMIREKGMAYATSFIENELSKMCDPCTPKSSV